MMKKTKREKGTQAVDSDGNKFTIPLMYGTIAVDHVGIIEIDLDGAEVSVNGKKCDYEELSCLLAYVEADEVAELPSVKKHGGIGIHDPEWNLVIGKKTIKDPKKALIALKMATAL